MGGFNGAFTDLPGSVHDTQDPATPCAMAKNEHHETPLGVLLRSHDYPLRTGRQLG